MSSAGLKLIAGRIPGERIATTEETTDSAEITTTETTVISVTAPVVSGRTYRVSLRLNVASTVTGDRVTIALREDSSAGTLRNVTQLDTGDVSGSVGEPVPLEFEFAAAATENKTFVGALVRATGTGTITMQAAADRPAYLYVDYIRG